MKFRKTFLSLILIVVSLSFTPCSLDHYQHGITARIIAKFPKRDSGITPKSLSKPEGAESTYVPSFVDKVKLTVLKDGEEIKSETNIRDSEGLSNQLNLEKLEYGENYSASVEVYTCNKVNLEDCTDSDWILTHEGSLSPLEIGSGTETQEIAINLEIKSGIALDNEPTSLDTQDGSIVMPGQPPI